MARFISFRFNKGIGESAWNPPPQHDQRLIGCHAGLLGPHLDEHGPRTVRTSDEPEHLTDARTE